MEKIHNPWHKHPDHYCIACEPRNPMCLHMEFYRDGENVISKWSPTKELQGWMNVLHGGIQGLLIDEVAAWVVMDRLQVKGVTSKLEVKYLAPIHITDGELTITGKVLRQRRNLVEIGVTISKADSTICTTGTAIYFTYNEAQSKNHSEFG
ncbi:MAG TPA: PaaI family thioesterase [Bacteroidaceae bacterium]|nr:PaaI family thioesterase [Bacteroidaceae bacterium]